jgi:trans-aconitate methyltransferase
MPSGEPPVGVFLNEGPRLKTTVMRNGGTTANGVTATGGVRPLMQLASALPGDMRPSTEIAPSDEMFQGSVDHYFSCGRRALELAQGALAATGVREPRRILDFPCGHGRVLRFLRAAYPAAEITACDLNQDGVRFCAERLHAVPVISKEDPRDITLEGEFDLIWCGSLMTHLEAHRWIAFIDLFRQHLSPDGVMVLTVNGPNAADLLRLASLRDPAAKIAMSLPSDVGMARINTARSYFPLPARSKDAMLRGYAESGFGYARYDGDLDYGLSVSSPTWVCGLIERFRDLRLVQYIEHGWDEQDLVACARRTRLLPPVS